MVSSRLTGMVSLEVPKLASLTEALNTNPVVVTAGRASFESGTASDGECRLRIAIDVKSSQANENSWTALISQYTKSGQCKQALRTYEEMQKDGVEPSPCTFVALLKACSSLQDLESAKRIHAEVVRRGFESDLYVGTMLVNVYAKCRSLVDARQAFDMMPHRNVVSWTAMILGYAQMNKGEEALRLYTRMQQEGVVPNDRTYVSALKACSNLAASDDRIGGDRISLIKRCLETVRAIHASVKKGKFEADVFVGNMLVDVYGKCGSLEDAREVFEKMPGRDVVSWNAMILGYAQMNRGEEGLQLYTRMPTEGVVPNDRTYVSALKACSTIAESGGSNEVDCTTVQKKCLEIVRTIHRDIVKHKFESDVFVGTMLVDVYAKCGSLEDARYVFDKMPHCTVVSWNAMISGYAQMEKGEEALQLYTQMREAGMVPDARTYVSSLKACSSMAAEFGETGEGQSLASKVRCLETVRSIHKAVLKRKFDSDLFVGNLLVDVYAKCGSLEDAREVFQKMPRRDVITWNAMILGYVQMDRGEDALQIYTQMQQEGVISNDRTYVSVLKACITMAECDGADGISRNERCLEAVRDIHSDIVRQKFGSSVFVATMLVDAYAKCRSLVNARRVFENMPQHDVVCWTAMILGYVQMDKGEEALQLYTRMQQEGVVPNERTYVGALNACGSVAGLEKGKEIHAQIRQAGLEGTNCFLAASLISMYSKCGSMVDAREVFNAMPRRAIVAWNVLIAGYANQGEGELVLELFHKMKQEGVQADGITFLGVLTVCSHVGLVDTGQKYFKIMTDYGITPTIKHFTCVVDLLGRSGQVDKAIELVNAMPFQPTSLLWECVLGACRKWGYIELGRQAFDCAVRLNTDDAAAYVLMSNIYAAAHMEEEAKEMQAMRIRSRAWKQPGRSRWTDVTGVSHVFVVGDQGHLDTQNIYAKLEALLVKMKKEGSVPHLYLERDVPGDEKEAALGGHSEKLAIAYALLERPAGATFPFSNLCAELPSFSKAVVPKLAHACRRHMNVTRLGAALPSSCIAL